MRRSRLVLFGIDEPVSLLPHLLPPEGIGTERYRCRLLYGATIGEPEFILYSVRRIESLKIVEVDRIDYSHKYSDRSALEAAKARSGGCDEIIVSIGGYLTDTTYSNIALYDGTRWLTPEHPLLEGTKRAELIEAGMISPASIRSDEIDRFESIALINAMLDLGEVAVPIASIVR